MSAPEDVDKEPNPGTGQRQSRSLEEQNEADTGHQGQSRSLEAKNEADTGQQGQSQSLEAQNEANAGQQRQSRSLEAQNEANTGQQGHGQSGEVKDEARLRILEKRKWTAPQKTQVENKSDFNFFYIVSTCCMAIIYMPILFAFIVGSGILSNVLTHIMIWNLNPSNNISKSGYLSLLGQLVPNNDRQTRIYNCTSTSCSKGLPLEWKCSRIVNTNLCKLGEDIPTVHIYWFWALTIHISVPYIYTFLTNLSRCCTKHTHSFNWKIFIVGFIRDLVHSVGLCILVFFVMPTFTPDVASVISYLVTLAPSILHIIFRLWKAKNDDLMNRTIGYIFSIFGFMCLLGSLILFGISSLESENSTSIVLFCLSIILVSVEWCEPFIFGFIDNNKTLVIRETTDESGFAKINTALEGWWIYLFVRCSKERELTALSILKILLLYFVFMPCSIALLAENLPGAYEVLFSGNDGSIRLRNYLSSSILLSNFEEGAFGCNVATPFVVMAVASLFCMVFFKLSHHACRIKLQKSLFWLPIMIIIGVSPWFCVLLMVYPTELIVSGCSVLQPLWKIETGQSDSKNWILWSSYVVGLLSIGFLCIHVIRSQSSSLKKANRLFVKLSYCSIFPDISLFLTRHLSEKRPKFKKEKTSQSLRDADSSGTQSTSASNDETETTPNGNNVEQSGDGNERQEKHPIPYIIACATMWHEDYREMCKLLKSIFLFDRDLHKKQIQTGDDITEVRRDVESQQICKICCPNQKQSKEGTEEKDGKDEALNFDAHIFFDDAFVGEGEDRKLNEHTDKLYRAIEDTYKLCYTNNDGKLVKLGTPVKFDTPYGKRYEWELSAAKRNQTENAANRNHNHNHNRNKTVTFADETSAKDVVKLVVHFKDKDKIRNKKRWSQVMYMYYHLAYCLEYDATGDDLEKEIKLKQDSTYILALDGDVDFKPEAVYHLLNGMKRSKHVGACCGRIHPIGSGPMVWYQKFEYAASHWLQKATEHVAGCVLCSPGCFTLLRASALFDDNVMRSYADEADKALQHIQYDQGEDRWLCTLLLKRGQRIEYIAAADAYTFAPEGFEEFYKQRRRWTPSTLANIYDIISDWRFVAEENQSITAAFLFYQMFLFGTALITPGTIFLLMYGAIIKAYEIPTWAAFIIVFVPVFIFVLSIFIMSDGVQLKIAAFLSGVYGIIMMVVIIGILKEGIDTGWCSETTIFIVFVAGVFIVSAILHPKELTCVLHGILYLFLVPSMSMLLLIYAFGNVHITSWGTREIPSADGDDNGQRDVSCQVGNICKCVFCPRAKVADSNAKAKLNKPLILRRTDTVQKLKVGQTFDIKAIVTGFPDPTVHWKKDDVNLTRTPYLTFGVRKRNKHYLKIPSVQFADAGTYSCVAIVDDNSVMMEWTLDVTDFDETDEDQRKKLTPKIRFTRKPQAQTLYVGDRLTLKVALVATAPAIKAKWFLSKEKDNVNNKVELKPADHDNLTIKSNGHIFILTKSKVEVDDIGKYICSATVRNETVEESAEINIIDHNKENVPLAIKKEVESQTLKVGDTLLLSADIRGSPKPEITWFWNNNPIPIPKNLKGKANITVNDFTLKRRGTAYSLRIRDVKVINSGRYRCEANLTPLKENKGENRESSQTSSEGYLQSPAFDGPEVSDKGSRSCSATVTIKEKAEISPHTPILERIEMREKTLDRKENSFWYLIIDEYLSPQLRDKESLQKQERVTAELKDLRNKIFFGFILLNALYVALVYTLTEVDSNKNLLSINITCPSSSITPFTEVNPISIAFTLTFGVILIFQFFGMIYHRISTFAQIFVATEIEIPVVENTLTESNKSCYTELALNYKKHKEYQTNMNQYREDFSKTVRLMSSVRSMSESFKNSLRRQIGTSQIGTSQIGTSQIGTIMSSTNNDPELATN